MTELSLRSFHLFFVVAAAATCVGFGVWTFREPDSTRWLGMASFAVGIGLSVYLPYFIRKTRGLV